MSFHFPLTKRTIIKKQTLTNIGEGMKKLELSHTIGRNIKW